MKTAGPVRTIAEVRAKLSEYAVLGYSGAGVVVDKHHTVTDIGIGVVLLTAERARAARRRFSLAALPVNDRIAYHDRHTGKVLHATAANQDDRMLLQIVADARDVGRTSIPLVKRTRATLRKAEFGFLGVWV